MGAKVVGLKVMKLCKRVFQCVCMASGCVWGEGGEVYSDLASYIWICRQSTV